jgi:hypothetical protein
MNFKTSAWVAALAAAGLANGEAAMLFLDNGIFGPPPLFRVVAAEFGAPDFGFFPIPDVLALPRVPTGFRSRREVHEVEREESDSAALLGFQLASPVLAAAPFESSQAPEEVPEPGSAVLLFSGLLVVAGFFRFSRKAATLS